MIRELGLIVFAVAGLSGCANLGYYAQAVGGHFEMMRVARPITEVIDDVATDPALKASLEEAGYIRDFASRELGLPDNGSYRSYADLQRPFAVWNVFAAREFSLAPEQWCMPVVGCVGYRGFYRRQDAEALADEMRTAGFDTYVGGVAAYSTLGYFSDPLLNTFVRAGSAEVARLIFHELAHQAVFVAGDTVFNESFATAVEDEGLRRWLAYRGNEQALRTVGEQGRRKAVFVAFVAGYRERLQEIYAGNQSDEARRQAKAALFAEMQQSDPVRQAANALPPAYRQWLAQDLNNAKLVSLSLYTQMLPAFEALLEEEGRDLPRFYQRVAALGALPPDERHAALTRLPIPRSPIATLNGRSAE